MTPLPLPLPLPFPLPTATGPATSHYPQDRETGRTQRKLGRGKWNHKGGGGG